MSYGTITRDDTQLHETKDFALVYITLFCSLHQHGRCAFVFFISSRNACKPPNSIHLQLLLPKFVFASTKIIIFCPSYVILFFVKLTFLSLQSISNFYTCCFSVINCSTLAVDPRGPLRMSSCGNHYGSKCNFSCMIGHRMNGSSTLTCVAPGNKPPGYWDNPPPVCQSMFLRGKQHDFATITFLFMYQLISY